MPHITILDGYVDEPTCLGVPPYISPYPRYIAGAAWTSQPDVTIHYLTIDQLRTQPQQHTLLAQSDLIIVIAGMVVPGRYLAGHPANPAELAAFLSDMNAVTMLCGPAARYGFGISGGRSTQATAKNAFDLIVQGDPELAVYSLLKHDLAVEKVDPNKCRSSPDEIRPFAIRGAPIVTQHPFFPQYCLAEMETYRGCTRSITGGCSFCSEPRKGPPQFRLPSDIHAEVKALYNAGIRHFRLGNQPCIFSYMAKDAGVEEYPQPNPKALQTLFSGIRQVAPELKTLHIDNANPAILARYPDECREIAKTIIMYHTSGDVAALGVESVDPVVIEQNNLKASAADVTAAVRLLNEVGSTRGSTGLPELLPGLNFVFGLKGESKRTFAEDYAFLKGLSDIGFLLRRINLRQVMPLPGTPMASFGEINVRKHHGLFLQFKRRVRETIERPLLQRLVPEGTVLRGVYTELREGKVTFGRQIGTYPLLVGIPGVFPLHEFHDVKVIEYGYRSVTGIPYPLDVNLAPRETLEAIPGIGRRRAQRLLLHRPFSSLSQVDAALDDPAVASMLHAYLT
jgi:radical SAM superfamily enzyme with C-terminal helix-hairpin-helix motif